MCSWPFVRALAVGLAESPFQHWRRGPLPPGGRARPGLWRGSPPRAGVWGGATLQSGADVAVVRLSPPPAWGALGGWHGSRLGHVGSESGCRNRRSDPMGFRRPLCMRWPGRASSPLVHSFTRDRKFSMMNSMTGMRLLTHCLGYCPRRLVDVGPSHAGELEEEVAESRVKLGTSTGTLAGSTD